jgi:integrase
MPARALTAAAVERIKPPSKGQADHFDRGYPGLALRCSYGGAKAFVYVYRLHGHQRRLTLGRWPGMSLAEAREAWRNAHKLVARGESPASARPAAADSFAAVAADWLKRDQAGNRTVGEVRRSLERDVIPAWRDRLITTITRRDAAELIDTVADRGAPVMARRLHTHLHRLFRWSVGRGIIAANPMTDLPKPGAETERKRVLSEAELAAVWQAVQQLAWPFGPAIALLVLTGARRDEIGSLRWSEIEDNAIKLAGARTKNGEPHVIPLSAAAVDIIANTHRIASSGYVFTTMGETPVSGWSKAKAMLDAAAAKHYGAALPAWRLHDLRRTLATGLQRLGFNLQVIEAVLGHIGGSRAGIVGVYQRHSFDSEKRTALEAWARHVQSFAADRAAAVTADVTSEKPDRTVLPFRSLA